MSFSELVKTRYSVRKFDSRPIEQEKLDLILEAGRLAPTAVNYQPQRILVLQGEDLEKLSPCAPQRWGQAAVLVVCYDKQECWTSRTGKPSGDVDGAIVMTSMMFQAWELGIGSCIGGMYKEALLRETFAIPDQLEIVDLLILGYPAEDAVPNEKLHYSRKPMDQTVCYGSMENVVLFNEDRAAH